MARSNHKSADELSVLYIEDEQAQRDALVTQLNEKGHKVLAMPSGEEGLRCLETESPDVILCDLNMPGMGGLEVLRELRQRGITIPFIIATGHGSVDLARQAIQQGVYHFVIKPFDVENLEVSMYQAVEHAILQRELRHTEASLQRVMENIPDVIYSLSPSGEFISVSPAIENVLGYKQSDILNTSAFDYMHADEKADRYERFSKDIRELNRETVVINVRMITRDGETRHIEVSRKIVIEDGKSVRADGIARDVTEEVELREKLQRRSEELEVKAVQLEDNTLELAKANVYLLTAREQLEGKHHEMENLLEELGKSKEELQAILDSSPSAIVMVNRFGKIGSVNSRVEQFFDTSKDSIIGKQFQEFSQRIQSCFEDENKYGQVLQDIWKDTGTGQATAEDEHHSFHKALRIVNPKERFVMVNSLLVLNEERIELGRVWIYDDVTALKRADEQLHTIIEASPVPIIISRFSDGKIVYVNNPLAKLIGTKPQELIGKPTTDFYANPSDRETIVEILRRDGALTNHDVQIKRSDGTVIWTVFSIVKTELNGQTVMLGGIYDVSERMEAERAMRVSEERFRGLVENANDIIFSLSADGTFNYLSPRFTQLLGWQPEEFLGKSIVSLVHPDESDQTQAWIDRGFARVGWETADGFRLKHKKGTWRWFTSDATVIRSEDGSPIEVIGVAHDITEIRNLLNDLEKANKELRETQAQLLQSEKMASLGMLVAGIAHEINTPIGAVNSMHDTLVRGIARLKETISTLTLDDSQQGRIEKVLGTIDDANRVIKSGTERVSGIIRRLRSFARLDQAELKQADIHEGLDDTLALIHHEIKDRITIKREYGEIPQVACFPGKLNQVFLNILNNARQAISAEGEIVIKTFVKNSDVHIVISDTGSGIPPKKLNKIFDPGFTTKGVGVGTGLGLSICYQIIKDHKGEIRASSKVDEGTCFTIIIPTNLSQQLEKANSQ